MKYWNNWFFKYLTGNDPLKTISVFGIHFRRIIYPVLRRLDEKMCGMKKVVVSMGELPKGPKIYAATHTYSAEDVEFAISTAGESVYLMTNGRSELLYDVEGIAMWLVGVILVDRYDKENRAAALRKAERVLGHGGNILIFPEGVWNMSPNLIVRKLYSGIWKMACSTKAPVIPVATMIYEGTMYISRVSVVLAAMGAGQIWMDGNGKLLKWLSNNSFNFYFLHMQLLIIVAYYVVTYLAVLAGVQWIAILLASSVLTIIVNEVMKRVPVFQCLYGLRR